MSVRVDRPWCRRDGSIHRFRYCRLTCRRATAGDEYGFSAVVAERLPPEHAAETPPLWGGGVEGRAAAWAPEPFVLRCAPQRAFAAAVEDDVDAVVADRIPHRVRDGFVLVLA